MNWSFKLFAFRGIDVNVHISFVLILIWASYYWGSVVDDGIRGVIFGIVATLLLFACVTLHEFGHAIQAQAYGVGVQDITLLPIGGLARLESIPEEPKKELRIAVAGPFVNVAIAMVLAAIGFFVLDDVLTSPLSMIDEMQAGTWQALLSYLLFANVWLVMFNLIPAFPMDGGRILRSVLAMRLPHQRATRIAAAVGQGMALLLGLAGFATGNYFLILIAIFIWFGAGQEAAHAQAQVSPSGTVVSMVMTPSPRSLTPGDSLTQVVQQSLSSAQSDFPVLDRDGYVVGLLSLDQLLKGMYEEGMVFVREAMRRDFPVARPADDIAVAHQAMTAANSRAMPVIADNGRLIGLLTADNIANAYQVMATRAIFERRGAPQAPTT